MAYLGHEHIYAFDDFITEDDASELIRFHDEEFEWDGSMSWVAPLEQYNDGPVVLTGAYAEEVKRRQKVQGIRQAQAPIGLAGRITRPNNPTHHTVSSVDITHEYDNY